MITFGLSALCLGLVHTGTAQAQSTTLATECDALAETINQNLAFMVAFETEIVVFSQSASRAETLADITAAADQYITAVDGVVMNLDGLVIELGEVPLTDADLANYRDAYALVVAGFADALDIAGDAMAIVAATESEAALPGNIEALQAQTYGAVDQIQGLIDQEADVITAVNAYCGYTP
jgi:Mlc titration factor MtfA (ptsG expression regulator)